MLCNKVVFEINKVKVLNCQMHSHCKYLKTKKQKIIQIEFLFYFVPYHYEVYFHLDLHLNKKQKKHTCKMTTTKQLRIFTSMKIHGKIATFMNKFLENFLSMKFFLLKLCFFAPSVFKTKFK